MISVTWVKCGNGANWCPLETVDLSNVKTAGVYIIWHEGNPGRVVRVGQGDIAVRLGAHRRDSAVRAYGRHGMLRVTWATVPAHQLDGAERYLANTWHPLIGDAFPDVGPLAVSSPFAA
jgi:hypothetical protein